jgi:hypothetical protein
MGARDETIYKMKRKKNIPRFFFLHCFLFNDHPQRNSVAICHYIRKARCVVCSPLFSLIHFHSRASFWLSLFIIIFFFFLILLSLVLSCHEKKKSFFAWLFSSPISLRLPFIFRRKQRKKKNENGRNQLFAFALLLTLKIVFLLVRWLFAAQIG